MADDQIIAEVYRKIEREQKLIDGANSMRQSTDNPSLQQRLDAQIREGRKNIGYLEEKMRELQLRRMGQGADQGPTSPGASGPSHGARNVPQGYYQHMDQPGTPGAPHSSARYGTDQAGYGDPGPGGYSQLSGGHGMMPPRAPFGPPPPSMGMPKARPNYSKLGK
jgi:classical protein kinase C